MPRQSARTATGIQPLCAHDRHRWGELWSGYLEFYRASLPEEVTEGTWRRLLDPDQDVHGLGAERDGDLVGIVHFLFHPVTWSLSERCYLEDLFVGTSARCGGVGAALIRAVYAAADERSADQVYWLTEVDNHSARTLYDRVTRRTPFIKYQR